MHIFIYTVSNEMGGPLLWRTWLPGEKQIWKGRENHEKIIWNSIKDKHPEHKGTSYGSNRRQTKSHKQLRNGYG